MKTDKQVRREKIFESLSKTGIKWLDKKSLSRLIESDALFTLSHEYLADKLFITGTVHREKCALRFAPCKNAVLYGPEGFAIIERDEVMYAYRYDEKGIKTSFDKMVRGYKDFVIMHNQDKSFENMLTESKQAA
jgi:hypothetical protein